MKEQASADLSPSPSPSVLTKRASSSEPTSSSLKSKKLKLLSDYLDNSPFPNFPSPTASEAAAVQALLVKAHGQPKRSQPDIAGPPLKNSAETCGAVPNVIDSLIGTILSQNTSSKNSSAAKRGLDAAFGGDDPDDDEARFSAIVAAPLATVVDSIRSGGLANKKAATIQQLLATIHEKHGKYSLQHLATSDPPLSNDAIMRELVSYDGVGPKTASCVLLFCLGRASFAVDTHVFRLSRLLRWVPASCGTDRVRAQAHLDVRIPDALKHDLHVLMVTHGRVCKGCNGRSTSGACILKVYMREAKDLA
ncbi:DNA glycosylase [Fistulina hepatica ATCC 64428]|uniref:DNA glycosylase n=1 Tax=Fistulina hepatica ATCC 64428 TaxID=1128425 RepID=A0A0D7A3L9_9AGAR|nr:DNA glycosylase [Fistulina hepatica ATCC 64428]